MTFINKLRCGFKKTAHRFLHPTDPSERKYSLLSFFLPALLLLGAYFVSGLFPIGSGSPLSYDLNAQYAHFFAGLKNMISSGDGILYSWSRTLGGEYFGIIAYYLLSPFNLLIFILPMSLLETAILMTILGKTGLIGIASYSYFRHGMSIDRRGSLLFALAYALCSYSVTYGSNLMWLDALIILPLLIWGIERSVRNQGSGLYVFSLAYGMITNYYMGFMLCILTALYFFVYRFGRYEDRADLPEGEKTDALLAQLLRIGIYTAIALAISAVVLLPAYRSLSFGKTDFTVPEFLPHQTADFLAVLKKTLIGSYDSVANSGLAFIYSGTLALLLAPAFFTASSIGKCEKLANGLLLGFVFLGFTVSTIDLMWHGFQFPNCLNYRYSFIFSFLICRLAARAYSEQKHIPKNSLYGIFAVIVLAIFCIQAQNYSFGSDIACVWVSLGLLAIYFCVLKFMSSPNKKKYLTTTLTVILSIELFAASSISLLYYGSEVGYATHGKMEDYIEKYSASVNAINKENTDFYRVERVGNRLLNDPLSLNIKGISGSTSTLNASVISLMEQVGYGGDSNFANYFSSSPVADSIFGIRYLISDEIFEGGVFHLNEKLTSASAKGVYVYENPLALSLAFSANNAVKLWDTDKYRNPFEANNALISALTGTETTPYSAIKLSGTNYGSIYTTIKDGHTHFIPSSPANSDEYHVISFTVPTEKGKPVYACFPSDNHTEADVYINGEFAYRYATEDGNSIRLLGSFDDGNIEVQIRWSEKDLSIRNGTSYFYKLDPTVLETTTAQLAKNQFRVSSYSNTSVSGGFTYSQSSPVLYTTIPYDSDWTLRIDGKKVETERLTGALLGADLSALGLTEGEHTLTITYTSSAMIKGGIISLIGVVALVGTAYLKKNRRFANII